MNAAFYKLKNQFFPFLRRVSRGFYMREKQPFDTVRCCDSCGHFRPGAWLPLIQSWWHWPLSHRSVLEKAMTRCCWLSTPGFPKPCMCFSLCGKLHHIEIRVFQMLGFLFLLLTGPPTFATSLLLCPCHVTAGFPLRLLLPQLAHLIMCAPGSPCLAFRGHMAAAQAPLTWCLASLKASVSFPPNCVLFAAFLLLML